MTRSSENRILPVLDLSCSARRNTGFRVPTSAKAKWIKRIPDFEPGLAIEAESVRAELPAELHLLGGLLQLLGDVSKEEGKSESGAHEYQIDQPSLCSPASLGRSTNHKGHKANPIISIDRSLRIRCYVAWGANRKGRLCRLSAHPDGPREMKWHCPGRANCAGRRRS